MDAKAAHREVHEELHANEALTSILADFFRRGAVFYPGWGNLGDGLIGLGTIKFFERLGWKPPTVLGREPDVLSDAKLVVFGGGGGFVEGLYGDNVRILEPFLSRGGEVVVLPSSILGNEAFFRRFASQITVFARERGTLSALRQVPAIAGVHLAHDMAFGVPPGIFDDWISPALFEEAFLFRNDNEASAIQRPYNNIDLALGFNVVQWGDSKLCATPLEATSRYVTCFRQIHTDRLHMSVLSAMLGLRVHMHGNSYHKNVGVFEHSLRRFSNLDFA